MNESCNIMFNKYRNISRHKSEEFNLVPLKSLEKKRRYHYGKKMDLKLNRNLNLAWLVFAFLYVYALKYD